MEPSSWRVLGAVAAAAFLLQVAVATAVPRRTDGPNASTVLAERLVQHGEYSVPAWTTGNPGEPHTSDQPLRAYLLPAEPLYLAAAFAVLPEAVYPYLHAPITAALITAVAAVGLALGGWRLALVVAMLAACDPFVLVHGSIWDDTFLAASLEWAVLGGLSWCLVSARRSGQPPGMTTLIALGAAAALAGLTRMPSQLILVTIGLGAASHPRLRSIRRAGVAVAAGVVIGVGAWGARNYVVLGHVFFGTSHDGITFLESNSALARASILDTGTAEGYAVRAMSREYEAVRGLDELAANARFTAAGWDAIRSRPVDSLLTGLLKVWVSLTGIDYGQPTWSARNVVAGLWNLALLGLAIAGLRRAVAQRGEPDVVTFGLLVLGAIVLVTTATLLAGPVGLRYRMSLAGALWLSAGVTLAAPWVRRQTTAPQVRTALS